MLATATHSPYQCPREKGKYLKHPNLPTVGFENILLSFHDFVNILENLRIFKHFRKIKLVHSCSAPLSPTLLNLEKHVGLKQYLLMTGEDKKSPSKRKPVRSKHRSYGYGGIFSYSLVLIFPFNCAGPFCPFFPERQGFSVSEGDQFLSK